MNSKHGQKLILYNLIAMLMISCSIPAYVTDTSVKYKELVQPDNSSRLIVYKDSRFYYVVDENFKKAPRIRKDTTDLNPGDILILHEYFNR